MKTLVALTFVICALNCALAGPLGSPSDDAEVIAVPRRQIESIDNDKDFEDGFTGVITKEVGYPFLQPAPLPFFGFSSSFDDLFRRLSGGFWPIATGGTDSDGPTAESGFDFKLDGLPKNGSTSSVKIVDGHKIEVNESTYGDENSVFKVRILNIRPVESGEENTDSVSTKRTTTNVAASNPVTSAPVHSNKNEEDEDNERREPLEKSANENEVRDIDVGAAEVKNY